MPDRLPEDYLNCSAWLIILEKKWRSTSTRLCAITRLHVIESCDNWAWIPHRNDERCHGLFHSPFPCSAWLGHVWQSPSDGHGPTTLEEDRLFNAQATSP